MIEVLASVLWTGTGLVLARSTGVRGVVAMALAPVLGMAAYVSVGTLLLAVGLPARWPVVAAILLVGVVGLGMRVADLNGRDLVQGAALLTVVALVALLLASTLAPTITADSYRYLLTAGLLQSEDGLRLASSQLLQKRMIGLPLLHAPAAAGRGYVFVIAPMAAGAVLALLVATRGRVRGALLVAIAAALALATANRFIFHGLYVNGHLVIAAWALGHVALTLRGVRTGHHAAPLQGVMLAAIAVTRPEGFLLVLLLAAPNVLVGTEHARGRAWVLAWPALVTAAWYSVVARHDASAGGPVAFEVLAPLAGAIVVLAVALALWRWRVDLAGVWWRRVAWGAPWAVLVLFTIRAPSLLVDSALATARNVWWEAFWGSFLVLLLPLVVWALWRASPTLRWQVGYPLLTFVPMTALLIYVREGVYRVGPGDSLARMLMHVVPLAVALIVWVTTEEDPPMGAEDPVQHPSGDPLGGRALAQAGRR